MKTTKRLLVLLGISLLWNSCATYKAQYNIDDKKLQSVEAALDLLDSYPANKTLEHSFYLIGDAGLAAESEAETIINTFKSDLKNATSKSTVIFLGDNIYPKGLPKENDPNRKDAERQLNAQIAAVSDFKGQTIFIPGNHDWYSNGLKGLKRQEKYIEDALGKDSFLPEKGCPIERINLSDELVLIIVDTQWYITDWDKHPNINDNCEFKTRARFIDEFESEVKKARGKTTVIAMHHPMFTNGPHGGQFSFKSHMTPLPVLGTLKNVIRETSGLSNADLNNKRYHELKDLLVTLTQENDKALFVSGHEHTLQYLVENNIPQIVSGAGSKVNATRNVGGGKFSYGKRGYARLDVFSDGSSWVRFYAEGYKEPVYQTEVLKANESVVSDYDDAFSERVKASVYSASETNKSDGYIKAWGERYRKYFSTEVELPTVNLDTLYGGLTPVRKGGGHQSKSLRFVDPQGREYVMRALRKNSIQYLQAVVFKDQYITPELEDTKTEALLLDAFTASHPYAPFTIAELAKSVGVFYTEPRLFYVPKQKAIGKFNDEFGDEIYMIEERAADGHGDRAGFGYSNELISTYDMLEELREDEDHKVDEAAYIRARLFDMVIGDWDRHQDQWRWAVFKEDGKTIYRPVPRDRDQAFSLMDDGYLMRTATYLIPPIRLLRSYEGELKDPKWFNVEPYPLDVALITQSTKADWDREVKLIQENLTEAIIDKAFLEFPEEVRDETIQVIKQKLIQRRDNLAATSDTYFDVVNKYATVRGTDKDDWFVIERLKDGNTSIKVYRIKGGEKKDLFHERIYKPEENKEVWVFGLDDDDYFEVIGNGKAKIKIRLIGGQNKDKYNIFNGARVHIYDYRSKESEFETNKGVKHLKDDYYSNLYDFKKVKYNSRIVLPTIGFNPDDGLKLGIGAQFIKNGYDNERFTSQHLVGGNVFFATGGINFNYKGEFAEILNDVNLGINAQFTSPSFAINFFGFGNSTPNLSTDNPNGDELDLDYNRVRQSTYQVGASLIKRGDYGSKWEVSFNFQSIEIENTAGRFISTLFPVGFEPDRDNFVNSEISYEFTNVDEAAYPTLGLDFDLRFGYTQNLDNSNNFSYLIPSLGIAHKIDASGDLVFTTRVQGQFNFGDEYEFYQAANLGANNGLRGFRNQRFSGKRAFFHSSDIRYNLKRVKTSLIPIEYGIFGGFDYGRVWVDDNLVLNPDFNDNTLNTSVGGGVFLNMVDMLSLNLGLFTSSDNLRFSFGFGFNF
ncbi:metallophosphoesterase [Psychroserpens sp.]|uniref:metallophosphoesterase n=1 Tax=Psychroserpens sp. TaxID=2020870 RepID=UPI001B081CEB|nr:metallophosphoesterase [Psychroserpens sp.]MBO6605753.1 metallophosphoesterase [Psychroserpens sp.]MBO6652876.1 metallophosphoesterase [Psychroserpens sp.]MBO6681352.1 metallophosphoesterase [Psychroserpens sp.]MBO6749127.1 metallophosphoesterase [Psychroserpens sp.]MBO6914427.1 metallophosphoesterase [Psychroserpens sp.]